MYQQTRNHPNIIQFYDQFIREDVNQDNDTDTTFFAIFEALGQNLETIIQESANGLPIEIIKKLAKDILSALKAIHDDCEINGKRLVHWDIKPPNIAACQSQKQLYLQLEEIVKQRKSLQPLRMSRINKQLAGEERIRKDFKACLKVLSSSLPAFEAEESKPLTFKLIDLGNATVGHLLHVACFNHSTFRSKDRSDGLMIFGPWV